MFKTTTMKLVELMILRQDIDKVLEYLGRRSNFEMQSQGEEVSAAPVPSHDSDFLDKLHACRTYLGIPDAHEYAEDITLPTEKDFAAAKKIMEDVEDLRTRETAAVDRQKRVAEAYDEARAFANLKVAYTELEHLTFLTMRVGKIDPSMVDELKFALSDRAVVVPLGEDNSRILAASSKKGRFALDSELKRFGFVPLEIPKDFKGVPDDVLEGLRTQVNETSRDTDNLTLERKRYAETHSSELLRLLQAFSLGAQVQQVRNGLEATQLVYRVLGWISAPDCATLMKDLDNLTEGRIAIRAYTPDEVPSVKNGHEKVPVQYKHGPLVKSFERMIFSYGAPLYGTIDPTPIVAFFFTLLFGIMFGDLGQGFVFFLLGLIMQTKKVNALRKWQHFAPIFIAIGCSSMVMGLLTGTVFANEELLIPFGRWVTGLFGTPHDRILELMPSANSMDKLLLFFGFTLLIGFIINSIGLVINIVNQFMLKKPAKAIFSKTGICGAWFFWYIIFAAVRILVTHTGIRWFDIVLVVTPLLGIFFAEPLTRLIEGKRPVLENGLFSAIIEGIVELLEVVSTYISNSISFLRVGAFALSHAVLSYIVFTMTTLVNNALPPFGILVSIFGNLVIIVLEGLIVAIQVIRLQYYEFFSKFFTETGKEFKPFRFKYKEN
ncbi:ATPase [Brucepastera parasyntrophica]|uniref:V-type ATP synthase subunit I n=1 Tax=Brucepastera parasyntrophica TaxID=2880008 RepID=UPI00210B8435|nr:V-type ATPase 116kDa subunit family protein [Brucepastera parasyntrophica]ULQ60356.1 ATPase [Brucepastera parasyntrophica]